MRVPPAAGIPTYGLETGGWYRDLVRVLLPVAVSKRQKLTGKANLFHKKKLLRDAKWFRLQQVLPKNITYTYISLRIL